MYFVENDVSSKNNPDDELFNELEQFGEQLETSQILDEAAEQSFVELKSEEFQPIFDEYYGSVKVGKIIVPTEEQIKDIPEEIKLKSGKKKRLKDPKGGLTAAGRAYFKKKEGANLKPGVKGPADTPEKMRRKGSFLTRFFTNPSGPMKDEKGRATRLALSAAAWGEPVPKDMEAAARLAAKGRRLLERYAKQKKSESADDMQEKALGASLGQLAGSKPKPDEAIDHDMDGMIFDGTPQEQRKPYKRGYDSLGREQGMSYEMNRRRFVRSELARQGIKPNKNKDRTEAERLARTRARARFDDMMFQRSRTDPEGRMGPGGGPKRPVQGKPADRYPEPKRDNSSQRAEDARNARKKPPLGPPAPKTPASSQRAEDARNARKKPDTSNQRAEDVRNMGKRPRVPVDRLNRQKPDTSSQRAETNRMNRMRPADRSNQRAEDARNMGKKKKPVQGKPADRYPTPKRQAGPPAPKASPGRTARDALGM